MKKYWSNEKIGDVTLENDTDFFNKFYNEKEAYIPFIKNKLERKELFVDSEDIFMDSLIVLKKRFFQEKGVKDYVELRKILFGIVRIHCFRLISERNMETLSGSVGEYTEYNPIYLKDSAYRIWYRNYAKKWREKNREKIRTRDRSPEVKRKRAERDRIKRQNPEYREKLASYMRDYNRKKKYSILK